MKKLKILHTMTWLAPGGGVDNHVYLTLKGLKEDFDFHLAVGADIHENRFMEMDGIKVFVCPDLVRRIHPVKDLKALLFFYRLIRDEGYDIVHTHEAKASLLSRVAARLAGCKYVIFGLHGVTFNDPHGRFMRLFYVLLEWATVGMAHVLVSVSKDALHCYHNAGIGRDIPSRIIYSGIDTERFIRPSHCAPDVAALRTRLNIADDETVLLNIGRFSVAKAQRYTIEAFARLKRKHQRLKLILVGEGETQEECRELARRLGVGEDVVFYGFCGDIPRVMAVSDIHVITSLREGLPRVVVEAALCKVPTAGFEVEGLREVVTDGESGFVVPSGDVAALSERIGRLIESPDLRKIFTERAFEHAKNKWDYRVMAKDLRKIYSERTGESPSMDVGKFFHRYAEDFDAIYGHTRRRNFIQRWIDTRLRRVMRLRFELTLKHSANPEIKSILDVGCGPGRYCLEFLKQGKKVVGLDLAEGMLEVARRAVRGIEGERSIEFVNANYLEHEFGDRFDAACLMGLFDYIENPLPVVKKLQKDIRKEVYVSFPKDAGFLALQRRARYWLRKCPLYLYSRDDIEALMARAGLAGKYEAVDCERDFFLKIDLR